MAIYKVFGVGEKKKYQDASAYYTVIGYIFSHARYCGGVGISSLATAADEMLAHAKACNKNSGKRLRHSVLSFEADEGITAADAKILADQIISYYADRYQMVYAVHDAIWHVHIHFVMNQIGVDGTRYRGDPKDYYGFREWMQLVTRRKVFLATD